MSRRPETQLPFALETPLERRIGEDAEWRAGIAWGSPRPGHGEGPVMNHIADVLANVEREATSPAERRAMRLIALLHDSFKYRVVEGQPKLGENHHATRARRFAERYISDPVLLDIIEWHDEAYHCWRLGRRTGDWARAEARAGALVARLGDAWPLYLHFFRCDNDTPYKEQAPVEWFERYLRGCGYAVASAPTRPAGQTDEGAV